MFKKKHKFWDTIMARSIRGMIDFLMSILSTPFCVNSDKTSNFVDLLPNLPKTPPNPPPSGPNEPHTHAKPLRLHSPISSSSALDSLSSL